MIQKQRHPNPKIFHFNTPYVGKMTASVDWVAGGNFDGYVHEIATSENPLPNKSPSKESPPPLIVEG